MKRTKCFANLIPGNMHVEIIVNPGSLREEMKMAYYHHRGRVLGALSDISFSAALQRVSRAAHTHSFVLSNYSWRMPGFPPDIR